MKKLYRIQSVILFFVGIGALFGGILAISDPSGTSFGASTEILKKGPFANFLIPGLFLFFIIGVGHLISFIFVKFKLNFYVYMSGGSGGILMAWIVIQCYMLSTINLLHAIFFLIGLLESLIALYMLIKLKTYPLNPASE